MIQVRVPATTANLGSGFDALGMALSIYNEITLEEMKSGLAIHVTGCGEGQISVASDNLAFRAAEFILNKAGVRTKGIRIRLHNEIPLCRGMGSSAAAIVGGMMAANELIGGPFGQSEILGFATSMEGHPDNVAAALFGGVVASCLSGGNVVCTRFDISEDLEVILAIPDFPLETKEARAVLPERVPLGDAIFNISRASLLVASLATGQYQHVGIAMEDRIHQPYRVPLVPGMKEVLTAAREAGALGAALSGAGPSVMALAIGNGARVADTMKRTFMEHGVACDTMVTRPSLQGATRVN